jgi:hypothetical protein
LHFYVERKIWQTIVLALILLNSVFLLTLQILKPTLSKMQWFSIFFSCDSLYMKPQVSLLQLATLQVKRGLDFPLEDFRAVLKNKLIDNSSNSHKQKSNNNAQLKIFM